MKEENSNLMLPSTTVCSEESCAELVLVSENQWHPNLLHIAKEDRSELECSQTQSIHRRIGGSQCLSFRIQFFF